MISAKCPFCGKLLTLQTDPAALPFCTLRCKQIDLGRWLKEGYTIPGRPLDEEGIAEGESGRPDTEDD